MIYELVLRNFDCSLEFVSSLLLLQPFNFSPVSFSCNFQDWGCVILREIDFLLKICWSIPCLQPSWKVRALNASQTCFHSNEYCAHIRGKIINILTEMGHLYVQKQKCIYFYKLALWSRETPIADTELSHRSWTFDLSAGSQHSMLVKHCFNQTNIAIIPVENLLIFQLKWVIYIPTNILCLIKTCSLIQKSF